MPFYPDAKAVIEVLSISFLLTHCFLSQRLQSSILFLHLLICPQDLYSERTRSQELSAEVQRLRDTLQKAEAELVSTSASLSRSQERINSLSRLLDENRLDNNSSDTEAVTNSGSSNTVQVCQSLGQESSCVDQTPATKEGDAGETERRLRERLVALEKEVCECA